MFRRLRGTLKPAWQGLRHYAKDVKFGDEARALLLGGVNIMADAVGATMGPKGRNAIIEQVLLTPKITKDGITVADAVLSLQDQHKNLGAKLVRDVANNTNNEAGDGTTTATILARAIAKEGFAQIAHGANPMQIREGIMLAAAKVCEHIKEISTAVESAEQILQVARIASNGDESIAKLIHEAVSKLGREAVFVVKEGSSLQDELHIIEGIHFDQGYLSPFFVNSEKGARVEYSDALLLLTTAKISELKSILPALELAHSMQQPLVIVADNIEGAALNALIVNRLQVGLDVCAVKAPSFSSYRKAIMGDIAVATGATILGNYDELTSIDKIDATHFGKVKDVVITKSSTLFLKGGGEPELIDARVQHIREELKEAVTDTETDQLNERLARLVSGIAVLRVGGSSELEVQEKKDRVTDALNAMRAAIKEGIVPGGGTAYLRCIPMLAELKAANKDQLKGITIVRNALCVPCMTIARNAGVTGAEVVCEVLAHKGPYGYDAMKGEYCDLVERGIIDSTTVVCSAITDAAGIGSLLTTAEAVITEIPRQQLMPKKPNVVQRDLANMLGM